MVNTITDVGRVGFDIEQIKLRELSLSALIKPAVSPIMGASQFKSCTRALNGLVQRFFWSSAKFRRKPPGASVAGCTSSESGAGLD